MALHAMAKVYINMHHCIPRVIYLPCSSTTLFFGVECWLEIQVCKDDVHIQ